MGRRVHNVPPPRRCTARAVLNFSCFFVQALQEVALDQRRQPRAAPAKARGRRRRTDEKERSCRPAYTGAFHASGSHSNALCLAL